MKTKIEIGKVYEYALDTVVKCKVKRVFKRKDGEEMAQIERFSKYGPYGVSNISVDFLGSESKLTKKEIDILKTL